MLSEKNINKINFNGLYSHKPDVKYRGKLYENDLYWCFNWIFKPQTLGDDNFVMIDTYFDDKSIKLTDENFDEFELIFDFNDIKEISKKDVSDYNDDEIYCVAIGSGGWKYDSKYFIKKDTVKNKDKVIYRLECEIESLEWKLENKRNELKSIKDKN